MRHRRFSCLEDPSFIYYPCRLGHQFQRPSRLAMAGTSRARTRKVSRKTPIATAAPICIIVLMGVITSMPRVPARMTPPVVMTARRALSRVTRVAASSLTPASL
jgi:hypothetical protein